MRLAFARLPLWRAQISLLPCLMMPQVVSCFQGAGVWSVFFIFVLSVQRVEVGVVFINRQYSRYKTSNWIGSFFLIFLRLSSLSANCLRVYFFILCVFFILCLCCVVVWCVVEGKVMWRDYRKRSKPVEGAEENGV